jgi:formylglycine-generating enzyme
MARRMRPANLALVLLLAGACGGKSAASRDSGSDGHPADQGTASDAGADVSPDSGDGVAADAGPFSCDPDARPEPNAGLVEAPGSGGCPAGMVPVADTPPYCIDRYEAALVVAADGSPWSPYFNPGTTAVRAVSLAGAVPQAYIDGVQAAAACAAAGKRLCTDAEWMRACRGPAGTTYPYGMPGVCNDARAVNPAVEYFGTSDPSIYTMLDNPCLDQLPQSLDRSGANPGCVTAEGAFDMMGNLHEWTADTAGTFRGGYYVDTTVNGNGCLYVTTAHAVTYWDYSIGFRFCAD